MFQRIARWLLEELGTRDAKIDFCLFTLAMSLNIAWCVFIFMEAFGMGNPCHSPTKYLTHTWLILMSGATVHTGMLRWKKVNLDGSRWGRQIGIGTLMFGILLCVLYKFRTDMVMPAEFALGMEGTALNLLGWNIAKIYHKRCNGNSGNHSGDCDEPKTPPSVPPASLPPAK